MSSASAENDQSAYAKPEVRAISLKICEQRCYEPKCDNGPAVFPLIALSFFGSLSSREKTNQLIPWVWAEKRIYLPEDFAEKERET